MWTTPHVFEMNIYVVQESADQDKVLVGLIEFPFRCAMRALPESKGGRETRLVSI